MKILNKILLVICLSLASVSVKSQQIGFDLPDGAQKVRIDFELHNNLIVIPITINGAIQINFILDTGVQYPILTQKFLGDLIGLEYNRRVVIQGIGMNDSLSALVCNGVDLQLPGEVHSGDNQSFVVLENDYLELRENLGVDVYGIIGYDLFSRFIIEINYEEQYLELYEPKKFKHRKRYKKIPLVISNTKPYMEVTINKGHTDQSKMQLMVDTGAAHSLLLNNPMKNSYLPKKNIPTIIGRGLGGEIYGRLGRVSTVSVSKFEIDELIVSFPRKGDYGSFINRGSQNGTIGGEFLSRFNVVFDYLGGNIYLKKNKFFERSFEYDMSGMNIIANGAVFDSYKVSSVRHGSPAYYAGIKAGDVIMAINGMNYKTLKLSGANALLRNKPGKRITLKIQKGETLEKKSFKLERFI